jgi:hypothetical protein
MHLRLFALPLIASAALFAQADRCALTGSVVDPSGAVIENVSVRVEIGATGQRRETSSNASGVYALTGLPVGTIAVVFEKAGFQTLRVDALTLTVGQTRTYNAALSLAATESSIQVTASSTALSQTSAEISDVIGTRQLQNLPINGRNWGSLMALAPGAIDTGVGDGRSVRFAGRGVDDNNFRLDGVDATGVRNQMSRGSIRLLVSADAIGEFRVNTALYSAESGGSPGGQVEVVSRSGGNEFHGTLFEYLRNSAVDARSPFDAAKIPPFRLNQFGASLGGPIFKNKTFFFANYEGLRERKSQTLIGFVPSEAFRQQAGAASPQIKPILDLYPKGSVTTATADILQWNGVGSNLQDENVGLLRLDHRLSDRHNFYFRFTKNDTFIDQPLGNATGFLDQRQVTLTAPMNVAVQWLSVVDPRTTNEFRVAANHQPFVNFNTSPSVFNITVAGFTQLQSLFDRLANGTSYSILDNFGTIRGKHSIKAGIEIRRPAVSIRDGLTGTLIFANRADFAANRMSSADITGELPTKGVYKTQYFAFAQDEIRIRPNLSANLGLRYEYFAVLREKFDRAIPFDVQSCGGYCKPGDPFYFPDRNNFAPRVSFVWSPQALKGRTVIRLGSGFFYGDGQLGDTYGPINNDTQRFSLAAATSPGLSYPVDRFLSGTPGLATAPRALDRDRRNQTAIQWGLSVQNRLPGEIVAQAGYLGYSAYHTFNRSYENVINPATGRRPFPTLGLIDLRSADSTGNFHAMQASLQRDSLKGLFLKANYQWAHGINDGFAGGGDSAIRGPQNVRCRTCERGDSNLDVRHAFSLNSVYALPVFKGKRIGGWELSGVATARTGLPLNVIVSRNSTTVPDGNDRDQRPDLIAGVSLIPPGGQRPGAWINPAAFAIPQAGTWGNAARNIARAPGLFQIDLAVTKRTRISERLSLDFRAESFNLMNNPQYAAPNANISSGPAFGRVISIVNTGSTGSGTPRQFQFMLRLAY